MEWQWEENTTLMSSYVKNVDIQSFSIDRKVRGVHAKVRGVGFEPTNALSCFLNMWVKAYYPRPRHKEDWKIVPDRLKLVGIYCLRNG